MAWCERRVDRIRQEEQNHYWREIAQERARRYWADEWNGQVNWAKNIPILVIDELP